MKPQVATSVGILLVLCVVMGMFDHSGVAMHHSSASTAASPTHFGVPDVASLGRGGGSASDPGSSSSWRQFRGDRSNGISNRLDLPLQWGENENHLWVTKLPGRGSSSPIAHLQKIYLTSSSGYGESFEDRGDVRYLKHHVICLNANNGKTEWHQEITGSQLTQELNHQLLNHGFASSTPATDGTNVYAFFGASGVFAFDSKGEIKWRADVGMEHSRYGSAASLVIYQDKLIVNASAESESVVALDLRTGRGLWRIEEVKNSWSTPVVGLNVNGEPELIVQDDGRVRGFNPETGEELWRFNGPEGYAASTPFVKQGVCFFTAGVSRTLTAFKIEGQGDITKTNKFWSVNNASRHTSPLYLTGTVYINTESGVVKCYSAKDGTLINQRRLPTSNRVYGSLINAGCHLYIPSGGNRFFVCEANSQLKMVRDNEIDRSSEVKATLCPSANSLLIRSDNSLHCVVNIRRTRTDENIVSASDKNPIEFAPRFDLDKERNSLKAYNHYLSRHEEIRDRAILEPFEKGISFEQREEASKRIADRASGLDDLRVRQRKAYWTYLRRRKPSTTELVTELTAVEQETLDLVKTIRREVGLRLESLKNDVASSR